MNPFSFYEYKNVMASTQDTIKKKKKKKSKGIDPAELMRLMAMNQNNQPASKGQKMGTTFFTDFKRRNNMNQGVLDSLQKHMWDQKDMLNDLNGRLKNMQREKDLS